MNRYVLGVDGGATKTQCILTDVEGTRRDMIQWGPLNHEGMPGGFGQLKQELEKLLSLILTRNCIHLGELEYSVWGLAGADTKRQHACISEILSKLGLDRFMLCNDAYLGIKAGCPSGFGICAINGTGCSIAGINSRGDMLQIGGLGDLTGDKGGGSFIGSAVVRSVYHHLYKGARYTQMQELMFKKLEISSKHDFTDILTQKIEEGAIKIPELNKIAFEAVQLGDEVATELLMGIGNDYAASINSMIQELRLNQEKVIDVVLAGSVNVKESESILIKALKEKVISQNEGCNIHFITLSNPPVTGAAIWALGEFVSADIAFKRFNEVK